MLSGAIREGVRYYNLTDLTSLTGGLTFPFGVDSSFMLAKEILLTSWYWVSCSEINIKWYDM